MYINKTKYDNLIERKGLKVNFLIKSTGVSRATFYKYVSGDYEITDVNFISLLANAIGCPKEYISK